ncbi:hypothetical protein [Quadrisphaera sp. INWT6]|uniref:hypothetical protein n=1 Tax=Quadrisphaera sp. INWT6 TaxID=2596917 RepID=UPI0018927DA6|nr:hypothetical protein [Quadrisphaera sp. INWT6]MBF5080811.1 hypothetical protein [Quadrisphaera sp. INWT6]
MSALVLSAALPVAAALAAATAAVVHSRSRTGPQRTFWALIAPAATAWVVVAVLGQLGALEQLAPLRLVALTCAVAWPALAVSAVAALSIRYQTRGGAGRCATRSTSPCSPWPG